MAWTHRMRSCSSSLANITVSPSLTALKKARPPSKPGTKGIKMTKVSSMFLAGLSPEKGGFCCFSLGQRGQEQLI